MKDVRRMISFMLAAILSAVLIFIPARATTMEHNGLIISVEMDKEEYDEGEPITATISVENTNRSEVTISNLEQLIPDGYMLAEDSDVALKNITLRPEERIALTVTFVSEENIEEAYGDSEIAAFLEGKTFGISNILLLIMLVIIIVIFVLLT